MNDDDGGDGGEAGDDRRRSVRHHGKHHKMSPPNLWPDAAAAAAATAAAMDGAAQLGHHHRNGTVTSAAARSQQPHALHDAPGSMCYTTNEVLVIIAVTCFLNFAFILLIMTCVHCFTDPSHHKKFGAVAYAELGDELFDADVIDGDAVTLLNPTKSDGCPYDKKNGYGEYDLESCLPYQSLAAPHDDRQYKPGRWSDEDLLVFE